MLHRVPSIKTVHQPHVLRSRLYTPVEIHMSGMTHSGTKELMWIKIIQKFNFLTLKWSQEILFKNSIALNSGWSLYKYITRQSLVFSLMCASQDYLSCFVFILWHLDVTTWIRESKNYCIIQYSQSTIPLFLYTPLLKLKHLIFSMNLRNLFCWHFERWLTCCFVFLFQMCTA